MLKLVEPTETVKAAREAILKALDPFKQELSAVEVLGITSYIVGQALAFQDQRVDKEVYMQVIIQNIEGGNQQAIEQLFKGTGTAQ